MAYALYSAFSYRGICPPGMTKREITFLIGTPIKQYFNLLPSTELLWRWWLNMGTHSFVVCEIVFIKYSLHTWSFQFDISDRRWRYVEKFALALNGLIYKTESYYIIQRPPNGLHIWSRDLLMLCPHLSPDSSSQKFMNSSNRTRSYMKHQDSFATTCQTGIQVLIHNFW